MTGGALAEADVTGDADPARHHDVWHMSGIEVVIFSTPDSDTVTVHPTNMHSARIFRGRTEIRYIQTKSSRKFSVRNRLRGLKSVAYLQPKM